MGASRIRVATGDDVSALSDLYTEFHEFHVRGVPLRLRSPEHDDLLENRWTESRTRSNARARKAGSR